MNQYITELSDEELRTAAKERNKKGNFSGRALAAQKELIRRNGGDFIGAHPTGAKAIYQDENWEEKEYYRK